MKKNKAHPSPTSVPPPGRTTGTRSVKLQEMNPALNPQLQVGMGFKLRLAMEMAAGASGELVPLMDDVRPLCLSLYLKYVCNLHCGGCQTHRGITVRETGTLLAWEARYCATLPMSPVQDITDPPWYDTESTGETSWTTRSRWLKRGGSGQRNQRGNP